MKSDFWSKTTVLKYGKVIFPNHMHKMTIMAMPLLASVKMRIPTREMPVWTLFFSKVGMTASISDTHEPICARLAPDGQTPIFLHHRQCPEAWIDLTDLPRATRRSVRQLVGRDSSPLESKQGPVCF